MNVRLKKYLLLILALVAFGCTHIDTFSDKLNVLDEGTTKQEIIDNFGEPFEKFVSDGYVFLLYVSNPTSIDLTKMKGNIYALRFKDDKFVDWRLFQTIIPHDSEKKSTIIPATPKNKK